MVRDDAREYRALEPFDELLVFRVGQQDAVLRPWEGLVGRPGEDIGALVQRVLELSSRDQAQDVGPVVPDVAPSLFECVPQLLEGSWEQEDALSECGDLRADQSEE